MQNKTIKVLEVCARLNIGGAQKVAANIGRYAPEDIDIWYLVFGSDVGEYEAPLIEMGHHIVHMPLRSHQPFFRRLCKFIKRESFDVVHCHTMYSCGIFMLAARLCGVRGRICHSHTSKDEAPQTLRRVLYKRLMRALTRLCATDYLACGQEAGNELYGERFFRRHGQVIKNGIETHKYAFDEAARGEIRASYGVSDAFVIGHVGHYVSVKNQSFLIDLFPELLRRRPDCVLLLFGEGEDREKLQAQIRRLNLQKHVRLMGNVNNVDRVLSALDTFVFPSLYEGTPLALIEAQANGLPCIISDQIPDDACLTDLILRCSLSEPNTWIRSILAASRPGDPGKYQYRIEQLYGSVEQSLHTLYRLFYRIAK